MSWYGLSDGCWSSNVFAVCSIVKNQRDSQWGHRGTKINRDGVVILIQFHSPDDAVVIAARDLTTIDRGRRSRTRNVGKSNSVCYQEGPFSGSAPGKRPKGSENQKFHNCDEIFVDDDLGGCCTRTSDESGGATVASGQWTS